MKIEEFLEKHAELLEGMIGAIRSVVGYKASHNDFKEWKQATYEDDFNYAEYEDIIKAKDALIFLLGEEAWDDFIKIEPEDEDGLTSNKNEDGLLN